jgi:hypothetical protein
MSLYVIKRFSSSDPPGHSPEPAELMQRPAQKPYDQILVYARGPKQQASL